MINKQSPKNNLKEKFFKDTFLINRILIILEKFLKIFKNQIENGAEIIQIFDSWAGLLDEKDFLILCTFHILKLVEYVESLNTPVICFPKGIKNYKSYCEIVKPDAICIDYEVDPIQIQKEIKIPVQGGLDQKFY